MNRSINYNHSSKIKVKAEYSRNNYESDMFSLCALNYYEIKNKKKLTGTGTGRNNSKAGKKSENKNTAQATQKPHSPTEQWTNKEWVRERH